MMPIRLAFQFVLFVALTASPAAAEQPSSACAPQPSVASSCNKAGAICGAADVAHIPDEQHILLRQKLAQLDQLQREIDKLRTATGTAQQILVRVQILELDRSELRKTGIDLEGLVGGATAANDLIKVVRGLKQRDLVKVLAEPSVVTLSGRPVSFHSGGEVPYNTTSDETGPVGFVRFGTELDLVAMALGNNKVHLELRARVSTPMIPTSPSEIGTPPPMNVRQVDTATELTLGQSAVLAGMLEVRQTAFNVKDGEELVEAVEYETLLVITPELFNPLASTNKKCPH